MMYLKSILGTLDGCPYAPRSKNIGERLLGSFIGAGASLIGNALGFSSSNKANETNIEIARMNNEAQMDMMKSQQAYNEEMWNKQNEFNDPSKQVERLLNAGINPSTVFGNGTMSEAGQLTAPQMPTLQQARVNPFTPDFSGVGDAANAYFQNQLLNEQSESVGIDSAAKRIDLQYKVQMLLLDMKKKQSDIDESLSRKNLNETERENLLSQKRDLDNRIRLFEENFEELSKREKLQNDIMKNQADNILSDSTLKRAQASYQNLLIRFYPDITQAQLNVMSAQFNDLVQSAQLKAKEGELTSAKAVSQYLYNGMQAMDYEQKELKHTIKHGSGKLAQAFWYTFDMLGDAIFGNLRLFGK